MSSQEAEEFADQVTHRVCQILSIELSVPQTISEGEGFEVRQWPMPDPVPWVASFEYDSDADRVVVTVTERRALPLPEFVKKETTYERP